MGYHWNRLDEPIFMAGPKPMRTEFGICQRLESCVHHHTRTLPSAALLLLLNTYLLPLSVFLKGGIRIWAWCSLRAQNCIVSYVTALPTSVQFKATHTLLRVVALALKLRILLLYFQCASNTVWTRTYFPILSTKLWETASEEGLHFVCITLLFGKFPRGV